MTVLSSVSPLFIAKTINYFVTVIIVMFYIPEQYLVQLHDLVTTVGRHRRLALPSLVNKQDKNKFKQKLTRSRITMV